MVYVCAEYEGQVDVWIARLIKFACQCGDAGAVDAGQERVNGGSFWWRCCDSLCD